jgi:serine/threonine protein kinase
MARPQDPNNAADLHVEAAVEQRDESEVRDPLKRERVHTLSGGFALGESQAELVAACRSMPPPRPQGSGEGRASGPEWPAAPVSAPRARVREGQVIDGKIKLERFIADGGMGEVWQARHLTLEADVAVKFTRPHLLDKVARARLSLEARVLARLTHPSVVRVLDFGTADDGSPFMVMELLRGASLADTLAARSRLSPAATVRILLPVIGALAAAHAQGVVHRDLKPDNVILVEEPSGAIVPKVFDFGIALAGPRATEAVITLEGALIGSPDYMAPEQASGGTDIDARADVWALCVIFYELVTGRHPFRRAALGDTLRAIVYDPVPPLDVPGVGDLSLSTLLARGLAKHPSQRWRSMQELGAELAAWAVRQGITEDSAGSSIRMQWLTSAVRPLSDAPPSPPVAVRVNIPPSLLHSVPGLALQAQGPSSERKLAHARSRRSVALVLAPVLLLVCLLAAGATWAVRVAPQDGPHGGAPAGR